MKKETAMKSKVLYVETMDTMRYTFLIDQLVRRNMPVILLGGTGTGKTSIVKGYLARTQNQWDQG
jgi:dynein heavy chain